MSRAPGLVAGDDIAPARPYAERAEREDPWHDRVAEYLLAQVRRSLPARLCGAARGLDRIAELTDRHDARFRAAADSELRDRARDMRRRLRREGFAAELVGECFALVREGAGRALGLRHFPSQLMAARALLDGRLVEMATGEGKTFAATLPACTMALAGYPVHVITVNDYLADRDGRAMAPLYEFFGLAVGTVVQGMAAAGRREAYAQPITYCSNKELAFDYLRDRALLGGRTSRLQLAVEQLGGVSTRHQGLVLRGLCYGLVDEADSVFIDEARTPLILSSVTRGRDDREDCRRALEFARALIAGQDYALDLGERRARLADSGREKLDACAAGLDGVWASPRASEELVIQALSALHLFHRDQHYVVSEGKVQIVDESTGRVMPDRSWERGLHQMIEAKEGCELSERRDTLARITYQRLFRRYLRLAGMSGTAQEVAREIRAVYRLDVVEIPLHRPARRAYSADRLCATRQEKWQTVAERVARLAIAEGRPVLVGTRSVQASEELAAVLAERGIEHALLNAKQDRSEADIVAAAGLAGRVTVATNMAGRGTDIRLGDGIAELGGLHVILTEFHESRRVDRQLFGRCARQGDPGSCEAIVSLEDEIFVVHAPGLTRWLARMAKDGAPPPPWALRALRRAAQGAAERRNAYVRVHNLKEDRRMEKLLAFSGESE